LIPTDNSSLLQDIKDSDAKTQMTTFLRPKLGSARYSGLWPRWRKVVALIRDMTCTRSCS